MSQTQIHQQRVEPARRSHVERASDRPAVEDMRLLLVSPDAAQALWAAVWALEDELSVVRRIQAAPFPRAYAAQKAEELQRNLTLLRDLLATL